MSFGDYKMIEVQFRRDDILTRGFVHRSGVLSVPDKSFPANAPYRTNSGSFRFLTKGEWPEAIVVDDPELAQYLTALSLTTQMHDIPIECEMSTEQAP